MWFVFVCGTKLKPSFSFSMRNWQHSDHDDNNTVSVLVLSVCLRLLCHADWQLTVEVEHVGLQALYYLCCFQSLAHIPSRFAFVHQSDRPKTRVWHRKRRARNSWSRRLWSADLCRSLLSVPVLRSVRCVEFVFVVYLHTSMFESVWVKLFNVSSQENQVAVVWFRHWDSALVFFSNDHGRISFLRNTPSASADGADRRICAAHCCWVPVLRSARCVEFTFLAMSVWVEFFIQGIIAWEFG